GEKNGLHINEDHYIVEIVDPASGEPLPAGAKGELVISTITREGFPLIRYRTGDMSSIMEGVCPCGRTTLRMERVTARTDDMFVVNGVSLFPVQINDILKKATGGAEPRFQIVIDNLAGEDMMEVRIEVVENMFNDEIKKVLALKNGIAGNIERELGAKTMVTLVEQDSLAAAAGGRTKTVVDNR
ncbi:MAG TPA: phenylacetate--CoA ligase, partial [Spirochaetota bacterium]|nr:phenylacetate--CoA ligase [Spirochaetota bacterium]